ncbi:hypothetical protein CDAR_114231 [Caerostris darwini]|uniref:Uncharacterized protein n=1 Tax=Caerostris darwini TaxID=1538125 RepID=A0AAV4RKT6_9ARAC|nr:hypothetical protein CDAR_114231 [Caerostris darwini]
MLHLPEKIIHKSEDLAMSVTVQPPDFEEILIKCRLDSTHTRNKRWSEVMNFSVSTLRTRLPVGNGFVKQCLLKNG